MRMDKADVSLLTILACVLLAFFLCMSYQLGKENGVSEFKQRAVDSGAGCYVISGDKSVFTFNCKGK